MFDYIDKLRKKPEPERKKSIILISLGITLVIAIIWGIAFGMRISSTSFAFNTDKIKSDVPSLVDTFSNFFNQINSITSSISDIASSTDAVDIVATSTDDIATTTP